MPETKWIAFYFNCLSELDPLIGEVHGWKSTGENPEEALQNLEKNPYVPFSIFLLEIVPADKAQEWLAEHEEACKVLDVPFIYKAH